MSEKRENSVLFSLRELRQIEEDRVSQEHQDAQARMAAEQRAREDAIRQGQEAEARRIREAEEAERALREGEERRIREEQLRLEESERKARVEGQMKLEHERMRMEMDVKASSMAQQKKPTALIAASVVLVLIIGGLGVFLYQQSQEKARIGEQAALAELAARELEDAVASLKKNQLEQDALLAQYQGAATEADRKRLEEQIAEKKRQAAALEERARDARGKTKRPGTDKPKNTEIKDKCAGSTDPLCGMN